jgi:hypothetical protein
VIAMLVVGIIVVFVAVIAIIGALVSTLSDDSLYKQAELSVGLPPRLVSRRRLRRRSQQLRAIEAALTPGDPEPTPRCLVPHAHETLRRR